MAFFAIKKRGLQTLQSSPLISRTQIKRLSMLEAPGLMGVLICGIFYISIERIIVFFKIQYHNSTSFLQIWVMNFHHKVSAYLILPLIYHKIAEFCSILILERAKRVKTCYIRYRQYSNYYF
jgi:hypothetical protein